MSKFNCSVGDLAITVRCKLPENRGNIAQIKSAVGMDEWVGAEEPLFTWMCEIATEKGWLAYDFDGYLETAKVGPVPDRYLRHLTPPKGYLMDEFSDSEQLQAQFHEVDFSSQPLEAI